MSETRSGSNRYWTSVTKWSQSDISGRREDEVLLILTLVIAAIVGLVVVAFILVTENLGARMYPPGGAAWRRLLIPIAGSLITGFLLQRYFPNARGSGIPQTKAALFIRDGMIRFRTVVGKFGCSSLSLASGIALGREGPSVQVAAGIASTLGRRLGLSPSGVKSLIPIASAAALAAAFNTPIAAVLFTLEEVMGDLHAPVLGSIVLSSATAWMVLHLLLGDEPLFHVPAYQLVHPVEFGFYAVLGAIGGLISVAFVKLLLWQRRYFLRAPSNTGWLQPAVGGVLVGVLGWFLPQILGVGYGFVSQALNSQIALGTMALLALLKVVATSTCYASGNAGGIFGPSLFIGAMLGGAFGGAAHTMLPDYTASIGAYALVGMGAAFAGIIRAPLTSVIMIFEVTRDYTIIVPLMIANLISYLISTRLQRTPIYEALQEQDGVRLPTSARDRRELLPVGLGSHPAAEVLSPGETIAEAFGRIHKNFEAWPVVEGASLLGMVNGAQIEEAMSQHHESEPVSTLLPRVNRAYEDLAFPHIYADDPLDTALRRMAEAHLKVLPVVSRTNMHELRGVISLSDILATYGIEGERPSPPEPIRRETKARMRFLLEILTVLAVVVGLGAVLSSALRTSRTARADQYYKQGNELIKKDRDDEAIANYRSAVSISHIAEYRLALALALVKGGDFNEAEIYLRELLRQNPHSGPANLGLARIKVERGDFAAAAQNFREAIYGEWPDDAAKNRYRARRELINALAKSGQQQAARDQLLSLVSEAPSDAASRKEVGQLLLKFGMPHEAIDVFHAVLKSSPNDAEAYAGLGEAELSLEEIFQSQSAFRSAVRLDSSNAAYASRLQMVDRIIAMDPDAPGLSPQERYERSRKLLEAAVESADKCLPNVNLTDKANVMLRVRKPKSYTKETAVAINLSREIWTERLKLCSKATPADSALNQALALLSR